MEGNVRKDLSVLRSSPLVRKELAECAMGFVYDLKTDLLNQIEP